ncbi:MAG: triose-phosphate isomerase [Candidatus Moranbacteria bacterium]|nr:triose-phosphate isomerase [Candidatus Moranbacteria bacterium]
MQKTFYVVGNLKMNMLSCDEAGQYLSVLKREMRGREFSFTQGVICPSFLYLSLFDHLPSGLTKGAQNLFPEKSGAYTGEISPVMLKNDGVTHVILGHSERRLYAGETDEDVREKVLAALKYHLVPVVCIGETKEERAREETEEVLLRQVKAVFDGLSKLQAESIMIAYEPRWAIGTDVLPTTSEILQVRVFLRKFLTETFDASVAERVVILYGGSVKSSFLPAISWEAQVDGVLVGRESLFPYELVKMMEMFENEAKKEKTKKRI